MKEPSIAVNRWFVGAWLLFLSWLTTAAGAQDRVIISSSSDPAARITKQGTILDYTGGTLKLRTALGTEETIPAARIVEIQTTWPATYDAAKKARAEGNLENAIAALREAKREERRTWAVRQIMSGLAGCYLEAGRIDHAGDEFLLLAASDPDTRHFDVIPIAWRAGPADAAIEARAVAWLANAEQPLARLLGASWLLPTSRRGEAAAALEELAQSGDERIAAMATIQLRRTKLLTATPADAARWQAQLEAMPPEVQAAGWYVLGDVLARQQQAEFAALAYLKVPLLFREQRAMAADALLAAGKQLERLSRTKQAADLYRELLRDFPHVPSAGEARSRLAMLATPSM